ncbi:MAG TPA: hypothetical protein VN579_08465 [Bryobacteraceae bacterium]|nr:hypothetical protein [Bryobacteraceae bacterium]
MWNTWSTSLKRAGVLRVHKSYGKYISCRLRELRSGQSAGG